MLRIGQYLLILDGSCVSRFNNSKSGYTAMVIILDGNSEQVVRTRRKIDLFGYKKYCFRSNQMP